jgi:membrane protein
MPVISPDHRARDEVHGIGRRFVSSIKDDDVPGLAAEIAYRFLFAVFPFGLFVAALGAFIAGVLQVDDPAAQVLAGLGDNLPPSIASALEPELSRLLGSPRADLLSIGAIAALWSATGGTNALVKGIHRAYGLEEGRPFLVHYAVAVGLTLLAAVGLVLSFVTVVGGAMLTEQAARQVGLGTQALALIQLLRWPAVFVILIIAVAILYRYAPSVVVPWRWTLLGAAVFALGWLVLTAALGLYATNVADFGATYGSLGAVIVLMLWFYLTAAMLIVGAEVTAAAARERTPDEIHQRGEERDVAIVAEHARERLKSATGRT